MQRLLDATQPLMETKKKKKKIPDVQNSKKTKCCKPIDNIYKTGYFFALTHMIYLSKINILFPLKQVIKTKTQVNEDYQLITLLEEIITNERR